MLSSSLKLLRSAIFWVNLCILVPLLLLALNALFNTYGGALIQVLFDEPLSLKYPYRGFMVRASEILWGSVTVLFFYNFTQGLRLHSMRQRSRFFLLASGIIAFMFLVDDVFRVALILALFFQVPKVAIYFFYLVVVGTYSVFFHKEFKRYNAIPLIIAIVMFSLSALADLMHLEGQGLPAMLEDGSKLLGIANILLYTWNVCLDTVSQAFAKVERSSL